MIHMWLTKSHTWLTKSHTWIRRVSHMWLFVSHVWLFVSHTWIAMSHTWLAASQTKFFFYSVELKFSDPLYFYTRFMASLQIKRPPSFVRLNLSDR